MKLLVFSVGDKRYALDAQTVKEIVTDLPLFYVPFTPAFVRGVVNRHGEPFTVIDLKTLFEQEKLESSTYVILEFQEDQVALIITDVLEILKLKDEELHSITSIDDYGGAFLGSVTTSNGETFVLNLPFILQRLNHDISSS